MLTRVTATEYVRPIESGRTSPLLVRCARADGTIAEVVVKLSAFCDQQQENLAMEAVAACLAGDLKLPIPEPMLVVIPTEWVAIIPDDERRKRAKVSSSIAFGSRLVTGGYSIWTPDTRINEAMVDTAAGVFAFDAIIQNPDRRAENPNCLVRGENIRIFDHELAFGHRLMLQWQPPWAKNGLNWLETKGRHIFRPELRRSMIDFDAIKTSWVMITDDRLAIYERSIPPEWGAATDRVKAALSPIRDARTNVDACIAEIQRVLS
jgi:hypothetical protein